MDQSKRLLEFVKYEKAYKNPKYEMRKWRRDRLEDYFISIKDRGYVSMLDVGCGRGQALDIAKKHGFVSVHGVEVVLAGTRGDITLIDGAHCLPFEDGAYQLVICTDVLEHILEEDVQPVLREMFRVASKAIHLTISHRADKADELGHKHVTLHPREWWVKEIEKALDEVAFGHGSVTIESDELTPPIKMPCTHLEVKFI